ncbi:MAG: hypothetical protein PHV12_06000, partial [Bacteroidales bacterium]|nr:hypothetical protein [Bacteroidales bacterium]
ASPVNGSLEVSGWPAATRFGHFAGLIRMEITGGVSRIAVLICEASSEPTAEMSISRKGSGRDFLESVDV